MVTSDITYGQYVQILHEELIPAMGCTEPIAIAYAAAKARSVLGAVPDCLIIEVSGNIIKNVKSVVVPHTGGLRGISSAAAAGVIAGDAARELEVISQVSDAQIEAIRQSSLWRPAPMIDLNAASRSNFAFSAIIHLPLSKIRQ